MVELATKNHPELSFTAGDAEDLPFPGESFDCVLINFGVLHFPDADKALCEAHRVLTSGGRLGLTAWASSDDSAIAIAMAAIAKEGSLDVDLPPGTPIFRFADHDECSRVLTDIGFQDIVSRNIDLTWTLPGPDQLMRCFMEATARTSGLLRAQDPLVLPAIAAAMTEACKPFHDGARTTLPMPAVLTTALKA